MNAIPTPSTADAVALTRKQKLQLLNQMYFKPHWVELIRLFRHQVLPLDEAKAKIQPLVDRFGKEPMAAASETMVEIFVKDEVSFARLKAHIRRMACQLIGPEPTEQPEAPRPARQPTTPATNSPSQATSPSAAIKSRRRPEIPKASSTPGTLEQYRAAKERHPNMLLLFRMGDFYELFAQDAEVAARLLGLTLTTRDRTLAMAGFPHHQLETYLRKLLHAGQRVAVCDPVDDSRDSTASRREVTRIVTPDAAISSAGKEGTTAAGTRPVRQPRHLVLKEYESWLTKAGETFVAAGEAKRTMPGVREHLRALDYLVMRNAEKLIVTVRPNLQAKHLKALAGLQTLLGADYRPLRIWPHDGSEGEWIWREFPVAIKTPDLPPTASERKARRPRSKSQ